MLPFPALTQNASLQRPPAQTNNIGPIGNVLPRAGTEHAAVRYSLKGVSAGNVRSFNVTDLPSQSSARRGSPADAPMGITTTAAAGVHRARLLPTSAQANRETQRSENSKVFWDIYIACDIDPINDVLSGKTPRLNPNDIVATLSEIDDAHVTGLAKDGTHLKTEIKHIGSRNGLMEIAKSMHVCSGTKNPPPVTLHASLQMTSDAMTLMSDYCKAGIPVKLNRFIPCSEKVLISEIAPRGMFMTQLTIKGYSAKSIDSHFNIWSPNKSMFSPLTICRIKDMVVDSQKMTADVIMEEIGSAKNAVPMPH